jgi:hypothetical protein
MFKIHKEVPQKHIVEKQYFSTWLNYLFSTIDKNNIGDSAEKMKTNVLRIFTVMQIKFSQK